jgi:hypothetical protein
MQMGRCTPWATAASRTLHIRDSLLVEVMDGASALPSPGVTLTLGLLHEGRDA